MFMAVPSYTYLLLKMSSPNGTIAAHDSPERVLEVEVTNLELVVADLAFTELEQIKQCVDTSTTTLLVKPRPDPVFHPAKDAKKFQVHPEDTKKTVTIEGDLLEEQEAKLLAFLQANLEHIHVETDGHSRSTNQKAQHNLNARKDAKPVNQALHRLGKKGVYRCINGQNLRDDKPDHLGDSSNP